MQNEFIFGFNKDEISAMSSIAQVIVCMVSIVALLFTLFNLNLLRRLNIVYSMRRVNDKYTELNILELENDELIEFSHLFNSQNKELCKADLKEKKQINMLYNHINILEGIYIEMKYKTMKKEHALKILKCFCPKLINHPIATGLIRNSGYNDDFIKFCLQFKEIEPITPPNRPVNPCHAENG